MKKIFYTILLFGLSFGQQVMAESKFHLPFADGNMELRILSPRCVRFVYTVGQTSLPDWVYVDQSGNVPFTKKVVDISVNKKVVKKSATIKTSNLEVSINGKNNTITVVDLKTKKTLFKGAVPTLTRQGDTYVSSLAIPSVKDEHLYGLGQFQDGYTDLRGLSRRLTQVNTQISIPMLLSSKGYGILWNNYGLTDYNPLSQKIQLSRQDAESSKEVVNVTSTEGGKQEVRVRNLFSATLDIQKEGMYSILLDVGQKMARRHDLSIDGRKYINMRNVWLPPTASANIYLTAGKHEVTAELEKDDKPTLYYGGVKDSTILQSPVSEAVDFTVFAGTADEIIADYRQSTGQAPLMPKWALGYIHCRERFHSSDEIISTGREFRKRNIPVDLLVQDWQYWGKYGWNAMKFDEQYYPDPKLLVDTLHQMNQKLMLSVWSKIDPNSELGHQMQAKGYYIPGTQWIDFFNPDAASAYWQAFSSRLLKPYHIDAWWQDATEPENDDLEGRRVMNGQYPGEAFRNVYPLLVNKTVYEGLNNDDPERRQMILTRCGYPGIQRYGAAMWSGDVGNDWETLRRQITAGLGMAAAGMPWWTYDAGGFFRPFDQYQSEDYQKRMLRWVENSVFLPLMRVHGYMSNTEPWQYSQETEKVMKDCIELRYRLLPYIYSSAYEVSNNGGTLMRPLVFDFPDDERALQQRTEYMFGKALLVAPVTEADLNAQKVYLPVTQGGWYDFYTGEHYDGGQTITATFDATRIPVFVRAGSILPLGNVVQSTAEQQHIQLCIYPGADGSFMLYDDQGSNKDYKQGKYILTKLRWDNKSQKLSRSVEHDGYKASELTEVISPSYLKLNNEK